MGKPASLPDLVKVLRRRIADHTIPPAARLREQDVSEELSISRAHARDVLDALVYLGFAERTPNKGVIVERLDKAAIAKIIDIREVIEGLCARLAAANAPQDNWNDLIEKFGTAMDKATIDSDMELYEKTVSIMRLRIIEAADNKFLADIAQQLHEKTYVYTRRVFVISDRMKVAIGEHRALLNALKRKDGSEAERLRRLSIANLKSAFERHSGYIL